MSLECGPAAGAVTQAVAAAIRTATACRYGPKEAAALVGAAARGAALGLAGSSCGPDPAACPKAWLEAALGEVAAAAASGPLSLAEAKQWLREQGPQ
eukprot:3394360-Lingulodinium_polyedra.AAC.1